jgi:predicted CopG family antitoxin
MHVGLCLPRPFARIVEAHERLKSRKGENQSFSEVIHIISLPKESFPRSRNEISRDDGLADRIEAASQEMRRSKMRDAKL